MRIKLAIEYSPRFAFVRSVIYQGCEIKQAFHSWKSIAIVKFCFDKKVVNIGLGDFFSVDGDELDEQFLKLAKLVPADDYAVWRQVCNWLENGEPRREVLELLQAYAVATGILK